ncbi:hypothetical protein [Aeromicrobium sp. CTD01-1L150]|uniref:hypothetical protein n=1 Tax=Aeromicrobium sp. CTD01-1L150 TaxID=3341830 RepID=UPI0035C254B1
MTDPVPAVHAHGLDEIQALVGTELGPTPWCPFGTEELSRFTALGDEVRSGLSPAPTPDGVVGAAFALACGPQLGTSLVEFDGFAHGLNYGYNRVQVSGELPLGSRFRMRQIVVSAERTGAGVHVVARQAYEAEGADEPFCIALAVSRLFD